MLFQHQYRNKKGQIVRFLKDDEGQDFVRRVTA